MCYVVVGEATPSPIHTPLLALPPPCLQTYKHRKTAALTNQKVSCILGYILY